MGGNDSRLRLTAAMGALTAVAWAAPVLVLACGSGDGANEAGGGEGRNAPGGNELQAAPADPRAAPT